MGEPPGGFWRLGGYIGLGTQCDFYLQQPGENCGSHRTFLPLLLAGDPPEHGHLCPGPVPRCLPERYVLLLLAGGVELGFLGHGTVLKVSRRWSGSPGFSVPPILVPGAVLLLVPFCQLQPGA